MLLKNQTKKIIKQKQEKNSIQSKNWKKSNLDSLLALIYGKIEKELNPGKNLLHTTTIPWWWYDDHLQIKKKNDCDLPFKKESKWYDLTENTRCHVALLPAQKIKKRNQNKKNNLSKNPPYQKKINPRFKAFVSLAARLANKKPCVQQPN